MHNELNKELAKDSAIQIFLVPEIEETQRLGTRKKIAQLADNL